MAEHPDDAPELDATALRERLTEAFEQADYFQRIAEAAGKKRIREVQDLSRVVAQLKATEGALDKERRQLLSIFDSIDEAIYVSDPNSYEILYVNKTLQNLFGPVVGQNCHVTFQAMDAPCPFCTNDRIFGNEDRGPYIWEMRNTRNGRWYRCIDRAITWPDGRRVRCELAIDVTENKRLEEELILRDKMESVGRLAGGIAHDSNNILTAIMAAASLAEGCDADELPELLGEVQQACERARALNSQLLTFARGGAPVKERASLGELIRATAGFALRGSNVLPNIRLPDDLWPVEVDRNQISQVIQNVVVNADQAMASGGSIYVTAENLVLHPGNPLGLQAGRWVHLWVADEGCGIPDDLRNRVFDPYFTTKPDGQGLGLATSYSIVRQHAGLITMESEPERGTTVHIHLPASNESPVVVVEKRAPPRQGKGRVLVMDDEPSIRRLAQRMLSRLGYRCEVVADGADAVRCYREAAREGDSFDVVIMDLTIPGGMGGLQAVVELKALYPQACAIASSGYSEDPTLSHFTDAGFDGILTKPYSLANMSEALVNVAHRNALFRI
jgi:signal transduction histidine kinase/CheY-like chemotaxis protein